MTKVAWKKAYTSNNITGYSLFVDGIDLRAVVEIPLTANIANVISESLNDPHYHLTEIQIAQAVKELKKVP